MTRRKPRHPRCPVCGKRCYPNAEDAAVVALKRSALAGPLRVYAAHGTWHLTSLPRAAS